MLNRGHALRFLRERLEFNARLGVLRRVLEQARQSGKQKKSYRSRGGTEKREWVRKRRSRDAESGKILVGLRALVLSDASRDGTFRAGLPYFSCQTNSRTQAYFQKNSRLTSPSFRGKTVQAPASFLGRP